MSPWGYLIKNDSIFEPIGAFFVFTVTKSHSLDTYSPHNHFRDEGS